MEKPTPPPAMRYSVAALIAILALAIRGLLGRAFGIDLPFLTLFPAVALASWYGGGGPAILTALLGYAGAELLFIQPTGLSWGAARLAGLLGFLGGCAIIILLGESFHRSRRRAEEAVRESDARRTELEQLKAGMQAELERMIRLRSAELDRSEQVFRLLIEGTRDYAIFMLDPSGRVISWNTGAQHIKGYSAEEIIGRHFSVFYPPEDIRDGKPARELDQAMRMGTYAEEGWRIRKDGSRFWASVLITALFDASGKLRGFGKVTRDQTGRKEAEDQSRRLAAETAAREEAERISVLTATEREQLRVTLESIGDAVIATDLHGNVTLLNSVAQRLVGWTQREAEGKPLRDVFRIRDEESGGAVESPADHALRSGGVVGLAHRTVLVSRDGVVRPIDDSAAPIRDREGRLTGVVLVFRDVTERRKLEAELKARVHELAEADQRKDEFLAILSHELRNPLAPLRNALQLLKQNPEPSRAREILGLMERQLAQVVHLVGDLLDLNRFTRGTLTMRKRAVTLDEVVTQAVETSLPQLDRRGHRLEVELPDAPVWLEADLTRLAQVFSNILHNAAKYTEPGGRVRLAATVAGREVVVSVRDNGVGIRPEMLSRVFEMFTQVDSSTERSQGGLGIGLSLVRRLTELHGGTVEARSEGLGKGSEFVVRLPVRAAPRARQEEEPVAAPEPAAARRVLVVDDNEDAATSLAQLLRMTGHITRTAFSGPEALAAAEAMQPEMVVLDIGLPGQSGYEICRRMREQPWSLGTVFVALTGWGQEEDRRRSMEAGFDHHLVKPVDPAELARLLESGAVTRT